MRAHLINAKHAIIARDQVSALQSLRLALGEANKAKSPARGAIMRAINHCRRMAA